MNKDTITQYKARSYQSYHNRCGKLRNRQMVVYVKQGRPDRAYDASLNIVLGACRKRNGKIFEMVQVYARGEKGASKFCSEHVAGRLQFEIDGKNAKTK